MRDRSSGLNDRADLEQGLNLKQNAALNNNLNHNFRVQRM